jgi:hypothetical protein
LHDGLPDLFLLDGDDPTDLTGIMAERVRRWDSCFTLDFSFIHGGSVECKARGNLCVMVAGKRPVSALSPMPVVERFAPPTTAASIAALGRSTAPTLRRSPANSRR